MGQALLTRDPPKPKGIFAHRLLTGPVMLLVFSLLSIPLQSTSIEASVKPVHYPLMAVPDRTPALVMASENGINRHPVLLLVQSTEKRSESPAPELDPIPEYIDEDEFSFEDEFEEEFAEGPKTKIFDPLSGYNRAMTKFNDTFYFWILKPLATGYQKVAPQAARISVNRFFTNLLFPMHFVNNLLQLKIKRAGIELARFSLNTTIGIAGFWDPAQKWFSLSSYPEDFGQTMGHYGVGSGFHIVLPLLGPSNLRDAFALVPDYLLNPVCYLGICYLNRWELSQGTRSYDRVNRTSLHLGEYESLKKDAIFLYPFLRDAYEQSRNKKIRE